MSELRKKFLPKLLYITFVLKKTFFFSSRVQRGTGAIGILCGVFLVPKYIFFSFSSLSVVYKIQIVTDTIN